LPFPISLRDLILVSGGLFLLAKGTVEIHATVEGIEEEIRQSSVSRFWAAKRRRKKASLPVQAPN
jgi:hypothetical protein